jgi:hypothetical protein
MWDFNKSLRSTTTINDKWNILIGNKILTFIVCRLWIIKQVHNE